MDRLPKLFFVIIVFVFILGCNVNNSLNSQNTSFSYQLVSDKDLGTIKDMFLIDNFLYYLTKSELRVINLESKEDTLIKKVDKLNKIYYTENTLWVGYNLLSGSGSNQLKLNTFLLKYDLKSKVFHEFDNKLLKGLSVNSIFDNGQNVLIGTDEGLFNIELNQNKVTSLKSIHRSFDKKVMGVIGEKNCIWISADNKLFKLDKELKNIQLYSCPWKTVGNIYLGKEKLWVDAKQEKLRGVLFLNLKDYKWSEFIGSDWSLDDHIKVGIQKDIYTQGNNENFSGKETETSNYVGKMWVDSEGVAWIYSKGVKWFDDGSNVWKNTSLPEFIPLQVTVTNNSNLIFYDRGVVMYKKTADEHQWILKDVSAKKVGFDNKLFFLNCIEGTLISDLSGDKLLDGIKKTKGVEKIVDNKEKAKKVTDDFLKAENMTYNLIVNFEEEKFGREFYSLMYSVYSESTKKNETVYFMVDSMDGSIYKLDQDDDYGDYIKLKK